MTLFEFDIWQLLDILILLLIGMGPKVALVPFLDLTADMDTEAGKKVANRMVRTAIVVALVLLVLGAFLMRLLHFTEPALYFAGGTVFLLVALRMLAGAECVILIPGLMCSLEPGNPIELCSQPIDVDEAHSASDSLRIDHKKTRELVNVALRIGNTRVTGYNGSTPL